MTSGCFPKPVDITRDIRPGNGAELALPFQDPVAVAEFAAGPETLDALWLAPDGATRGALRFAAFDGVSWSASVVIAPDVDLEASRERGLSLEVLKDGGVRARWFETLPAGGHAPHIAASNDGGRTWHRVADFAAPLASGAGPISWIDLGNERQAAAFIALSRRAFFDQKFPTVFAALPGPTATMLSPMFVGSRAPQNSAIATMRVKNDFVFAFRRFGRLNRVGEQQTTIFLDRIEGGRPKRLLADHDRWAFPRDARGVGPLLAAREDVFSLLYYSDKRQGHPAIVVWQTPFTDGRAFPTLGRVRDLHANYAADGRLILAGLENGSLLVRRLGTTIAIARITDVPVDATTTLLFAGDVQGYEYLAWSGGDPLRIHLVRLENDAP